MKYVDKILVETDFLFGLRKSDKLNKYVMKLLQLHRRGEFKILISSPSFLEVALVLLSRGFKPVQASRVLELMKLKLQEYRVRDYVSLTPEVVIQALFFKNKYNITFFDSLHLSGAKVNNLTLVTRDKTLLRVAEQEKVKNLPLTSFL